MLKSTILKSAAAGIASAFSALSLPASAAEAERLALRFDVFAKGLQVFDIKYNANITRTAYDIDVKMKPTGFAGLFINRKLTMSAAGVIRSANPVPRKFGYSSKKKKNKIRTSVTWSGNAKPDTKRSRPLSKYKTKSISRALKPGLPDPLTTLLRIGLSDSAAPCSQDQRVYNGQEVYDLRFRLIARENLGKGDGGVYRGPAYKCRMTYLPVAGLSKNRQAKLTANPLRFTVWLAPVQSRALGRQILMPVAATGKLKDSDFVAYTRRATISGRPFNARSIASK
jgi:hypothetical protein